MHIEDAPRLWITRQAREFKSECLQPKFCYLNFCMIWGAVSGPGKGPMVIWDKDANRNISWAGYRAPIFPILHDYWNQFRTGYNNTNGYAHDINKAGDSIMMMQNGAPTHRARETLA